MIVRQFLQWIRHAPPGERAEATSALARAYLYSDLSNDDLAAAEGAMIMLLDDPSPLVRRALADVFATSQKAPPVVIHALATDQPEIAMAILALSPMLQEADLIDLVATAQPAAQMAIASRAMLPRSLAAAIAEVGSAQACLALLENSDADIAPFSIDRVVERFGHLAAIRENLLARADLPMATRQALLAKLSQHARRLRRRAAMARFGTRRRRRARSLRKGDRGARRRHALRRSRPPGAAFARQRTTHRRDDLARAVVRQRRAGRGSAGGFVRRADRARHQLYPRPQCFRLRRALPQGRAAGPGLSGVPRSDRRHARRRPHWRTKRGGPAQTAHGRARARRLRSRTRPRSDFALGAAAAVRGRGGARRSAHVLRRSGRQRRSCDRSRPRSSKIPGWWPSSQRGSAVHCTRPDFIPARWSGL